MKEENQNNIIDGGNGKIHLSEQQCSQNFDGSLFEDLSKLKLPDYSAQTSCNKVITEVFVQKPNKQWFVRVHDKWHDVYALLTVADTGETYLVVPKLVEFLLREIDICHLYTAINRQSDVFLWPIKISSDTRWSRTAQEIAEKAKTRWLRIVSNKNLGCYEMITPEDDLPEPQWPDLDQEQIIKLAFQSRIITSLDHQVIKSLKGRS